MSHPVADPETPDPRRRLALLVAVAAAVRALLLLLPRQIRWDEPAYLLIGRSLWSGGGFTLTGAPEVHYPPLFPALFGGTWKLVGSPEAATNLWLVVAGALLVLPVHALAARAFDRRVAFGAALLVAVFPGLTTSVLYWGSMTEPVFVLLLYWAAWLVLRGVEAGDWRRPAAAGAVLALAYLGRPEAVGWAVSLAAAAVAVRALAGKLRSWRTAAILAALGLSFALFAVPYVLYLHRETGLWMLSGKLGITYDLGAAVLTSDAARYDEITNAIDPETGEVRWESERRFETPPAPRTASLAVRVLGNLRRIAARAAVQPVFPIALLPFVFVAWLGKSWRRDRWAAEAWLWASALPVLAFLAYHVHQRFFAPAFPALLVWTAAGLATAGDWLARRWPAAGRWPWRALLVAVAASFALAHATVLRTQLPTLRDVHRDAGLWLRDNSPADARVLAYELAVCVWARRSCLQFPRASIEDVLAYARERGGSYVLIDEEESREARPFLLPLLDPAANLPEGLERVFTTSDAHGRAVVFRIVPYRRP
ncbi:MAG TPA: glycosyltransferase family 39 protein [Thermoanaerobaculia bacterium]